MIQNSDGKWTYHTSPSNTFGEPFPSLSLQPLDPDITVRIRPLTEMVPLNLVHPIVLKSYGLDRRSGRTGTGQSRCAKCRSLDSPRSIFVLNFSEYVQTCLIHISSSTRPIFVNFASMNSQKCVEPTYSIKNSYSSCFIW
jgi:hypothetical protein